MDEFTLTDEQVETWRKLLITMPVPPFGRAIGVYALLAPREQIVDIVRILQERMNLEAERLKEEEKPSNITRTRPRKKNLVRR